MKRLEITFSEEDVRVALETYINRFFLPHRQIKIQAMKRDCDRGFTAVVIPAPAEFPTVGAAES